MSQKSWIPLILVALMFDATARRAPQQAQEQDGATLPLGCSWSAISGDALLARRLGAVDVTAKSLATEVLAVLRHRSIPISFLEGDKDSLVTLHFVSPTLRDVLEAIIVQAPEYKYSFVRGHLMLYPRKSAYELPLQGVALAAMPRIQATVALVEELRGRYPVFAKLESPVMSGTTDRHFLYDDLVTVKGADAVLDGLAQILGDRPGAALSIELTRWEGRAPLPGELFLNLQAVEVLTSIEVRPVLASLRVGEQVQLKVMAALVGGARQDVTASACGTSYQVSDKGLVSVDSNGLLRALSAGNEQILIQSEMQMASLSFKVIAGAAKISSVGPAEPRSLMRPRGPLSLAWYARSMEAQ